MDPASSPSRPTLRPGTVDDAAAIADYHLRASRRSFETLLTSGTYDGARPRVERFTEWLAADSGFSTIVADVDGTPVGHVTISGNEVVHLFIDPDHQGRGLGRRLLATGEAMLADAGHDDIELHTMIGNAPAIALYESAGWVVTDGVIDNEHDGVRYREHVLVKRLGSA
jgi:GNAT superfamily N-acetyltransferase